MTTFVDLVTDSGELIRVECPDKFNGALYETLSNAMKRGDEWAPGQFDGCKAEYLGYSMSRVNMKKIVGML